MHDPYSTFQSNYQPRGQPTIAWGELHIIRLTSPQTSRKRQLSRELASPSGKACGLSVTNRSRLVGWLWTKHHIRTAALNTSNAAAHTDDLINEGAKKSDIQQVNVYHPPSLCQLSHMTSRSSTLFPSGNKMLKSSRPTIHTRN